MFDLIEIKPRIFHANFKSTIQMCEVFMRCQETYESPGRNFRNQRFTIADFSKWYSKKFGDGEFTYNEDWSGFNLPSSILDFVFQNPILDENDNDLIMRGIYNQAKSTHDEFYLIASASDKEYSALDHELAHGLFYTDKAYRETMKRLVRRLPYRVKKVVYTYLKKQGYTHHVYVDETQAYLATGFDSDLDFDTKDFVDVFDDWCAR